MNICKFNTSTPAPDTLYTLNFVYETEDRNMLQFRSDTAHRIHLVTDGIGKLHTIYGDFEVKAGDIFFTFAAAQYSIESASDLKYMYISFLGIRANMLIEIWECFLKKSDTGNIDLISESGLLYAFSIIERKNSNADISTKYKEKILLIKKYLDENYCDIDFTIEKLANELSYSKKYISEIFKKEFGLPVQQYVTLLRIQNACSLMEKRISCISDISKLCGFSDPLYFSKVFKKKMGVSPKEYIKESAKSSLE